MKTGLITIKNFFAPAILFSVYSNQLSKLVTELASDSFCPVVSGRIAEITRDSVTKTATSPTGAAIQWPFIETDNTSPVRNW